jgi:hypothetical protein
MSLGKSCIAEYLKKVPFFHFNHSLHWVERVRKAFTSPCWLMMESHLINTSHVENTVKAKIHSIHLTYQTSWFINTADILHIEWLAGRHYSGHKNIIPLIGSPEKQSTKFKFKVQFLLSEYCFCTIIKLENCNSNHLQSKIICICSRNGSHFRNCFSLHRYFSNWVYAVSFSPKICTLL